MTSPHAGKELSTGSTPTNAIARHIEALVEALPIFDRKTFEAAVAEAKEHPRASLHYLFERFGSDDPAIQAMVNRVLVECAGPDVIDNLNAVIFDADRNDRIKVMANDLLATLGRPVDADVFAMSVPDPEPLQRKLPSRVKALLAEEKTDAAIEAALALHPAERAVLISDVLRENAAGALALAERLVRENSDGAKAVVAAIGAAKFEAGVPLVQALQQNADRSLQRLIRKTLFDLREGGVAVPGLQATAQHTPGTASAQDAAGKELPLYRALMSDVSPAGSTLVVVARRRPDGRLRVLSVVVSLWKRGIQQAAANPNMSRSSFERFLRNQPTGRLVLKEAALDACRNAVARGIRVAKDFGTPLPFDFGAGKSLLGAVDEAAETMETPFLCSVCGEPLDAHTVANIRASAPYENIPVETRCARCREEKT